jgi:hypothetical protein
MAATTCVAALELKIPVLLDDMDDSVAQAFQGFPDRLFILSPDGTIAYRGEKGPRGFNVTEMKTTLEKLLAAAEKKE